MKKLRKMATNIFENFNLRSFFLSERFSEIEAIRIGLKKKLTSRIENHVERAKTFERDGNAQNIIPQHRLPEEHELTAIMYIIKYYKLYIHIL